MARGKKKSEEDVEGDLLTQDPTDPEESALASERRKALDEERIVQSRKRKAKAEKELSNIVGGEEGEITTQSGAGSYLSDFKKELNTNEGWKVYVERVRPRKFKGVEMPRNTCVFETPMDFEEIEAELEQSHGGGSYKLTLKDDDYRFRGRRQITITGEPKMPEGYDEDESESLILGRRGMRFGPDMEDEDDPLDEEAKLKKEIRVAGLQKQLTRISGDEESKESMQETLQSALAEQREVYERKLDAITRKQELQELVAPLMQEISSLKNEPNRNGESDELKMLKEQMANDRETHKEQMAQMREERLREESKAQMELLRSQLEEVKKGSNNGADPTMSLMMKALDNMGSKSDAQINMISGGMTEMMKGQVSQWQSMVNKMMEQKDPGSKTSELRDLAETMMAINGVMGGGGGEEPKDLPTALLSAVEKIVPQVLNEMKEGREMMAGGQGDMLKLAARMTEEIKSEVRAQYRAGGGAPTGPPPPVAVAPPSNSVPIGSPTPPPTGRPQSVPDSMSPVAGDPPAMEAKSPTPNPPGVPSVPEERRQRVNLVLDYIARDMEILPGTPQWPYAAWQVLPGDIRMAIVKAGSDEDVYHAIKDEGDLAKLEDIWKFIKEEGEHRSFFIKGINQIKKWYKEGGPPDATAAGTAGAEPPATP